MITGVSKIIFLSICILILHELTHLLILSYYKIPFKFVLTKKLVLGFKINLIKVLKYKKQVYLLPLLWCIPIGLYHGWFWGIFTIILGLKDITDYIWLSSVK